jgi:hypothetical protein
MRLTPLLILILVLGACASQFSVPPVTRSATGEHLPGKIIWHDLLSDTPVRTEVFYSELFGWEFEALADKSINYTLIRHNGKLIGGMVDQNRLPNKKDISQWVVGLSVADIEAATAALRGAGGTVFTPPTSLGDRGHIAVVADQQGAVLALLQTRAGDPPDHAQTPSQGEFLWDELWAEDVAGSVHFYGQLAQYSVLEETLGTQASPVEYHVLKSRGRARAGIRSNPVEDLMPMWVSYLRISDAAELDAILAQVEPLGGNILVPATERPGGGVVAVIAGPSGAGIALQTWDENQTIDKLLEERQ